MIQIMASIARPSQIIVGGSPIGYSGCETHGKGYPKLEAPITVLLGNTAVSREMIAPPAMENAILLLSVMKGSCDVSSNAIITTSSFFNTDWSVRIEMC